MIRARVRVIRYSSRVWLGTPLLLLLFLSGCTHYGERLSAQGEELRVRFEVQVPATATSGVAGTTRQMLSESRPSVPCVGGQFVGGSDAPARGLPTRTQQVATESNIAQLRVLVFEDSLFQYQLRADELICDSSTHTAGFTAKIRSTTQPLTLWFVANSDDILAAYPPQTGQSLSVIAAQLVGETPANGVSGDLPMFGRLFLSGGLTATSAHSYSGILMLRAVARVDIRAENALADFQMHSVQAFRVAHRFQLIPYNLIGGTNIPSGTTYTLHTIPIAVSAPSLIGALYLPESTPPADMADATCVVVGGYFRASATLNYYRVNFSPLIEGHPPGKILRNRRYVINLRYVSGPGYATPEEAAANPASAVVSTTVSWSDQIRYMIYDATDELGVSEIHVQLASPANSSAVAQVETSLPGYTISWADATGTPQGATTTTMLDNGVFRVTKAANGSTLTFSTVSHNPAGSDDRTAYVLVQASSNLTQLLTLIQPADLQGAGAIWAAGNVDAPGTFAPIGEQGKYYQWNRRVGWDRSGNASSWNPTPADGFLWAVANNPCPAGWRLPTTQELTDLSQKLGRTWRMKHPSDYPLEGVWFADTQAEADAATLASPGNAIFLPAVGYLSQNNGSNHNRSSNGYFWASDLLYGDPALLSIAHGSYLLYGADSGALGHSVRCIKEG